MGYQRWRPRIRLATLLLLTTLVAVLIAWAIDHQKMGAALDKQNVQLVSELSRQRQLMRIQQYWQQLPSADNLQESRAKALDNLSRLVNDKQLPAATPNDIQDNPDLSELQEQLSEANARVKSLEKRIQLLQTTPFYDNPTPGIAR